MNETTPPAPTDLRMRRADRLRTAIQNGSMSYATRSRTLTAIHRYEMSTGPKGDAPADLVFDRLIEIGEICATNPPRLLSREWAISAIERMMQSNPDL